MKSDESVYLSVDEKRREWTINKITINRMTINRMTINRMTINRMRIKTILFYEMSNEVPYWR